MSEQPNLLVTLPNFTSDESWLLLSDKIIEASNIKEDTHKFLILYKSLPPSLQKDYQKLLSADDDDDLYDQLVHELNSRFTMRDSEKFKTLHTLEMMGDRTPKQFLRDLQNKYTAAGGITNQNLKYAYALGLPVEYRHIVFSNSHDNLDDAAAQVEDIYSMNKQLNNFSAYGGNPVLTSSVTLAETMSQPTVNAANISKQSLNLEKENLRLANALADMTETLKKLNTRIDNLENKNVHQQPSLSANHFPKHQSINPFQNYYPNPTSANPSSKLNSNSPAFKNYCPITPSANNSYGLCFYHCSFGVNARKCDGNCNWSNFKIPPHSCSLNPCPWDRYNVTYLQKN